MDRNAQSLNTLRGLACLLLVSFHIIGSTPALGLKIDAGLLREVNDLLAYLRMPLFTFLSGVVYCYRPVTNLPLRFIRGKARRLLLPLLTVGTGFALLQMLIPATNSGDYLWWQIHIYPVAHFWFIQSLFWVFLLIVLIERWGWLNRLSTFIGCWLAAAALFLSPLEMPVLSISGAIYLLPFFLMGVMAQRFISQHPPSLSLARLGLPLALLALLLIVVGALPLQPQRSLLGLLIGVVACVGLWAWRPQWSGLALIGHYSYSIYLFHVFFTAATRMGLMKLGITEVVLLLPLSLLTGIVGPLLLERIIVKMPLLPTLLLGKRWPQSALQPRSAVL
ncbi:acyltransferase family protein [Ferrimonas senticii]|uniref:acyltransferase family protein n=1 Tax=Ferrimonas senticii TaxID=394566 RepID=UPI0004098847|nr:acyltransferase [Ferrimonas senticii]